MFGAKYSRLKFWIISICLLIPDVILINIAKAIKDSNTNNELVFHGIILLISLIWMNTLANRIRDYGSNPWISLFSIIPLLNVILALYYGIANKKNIDVKSIEINDLDTSISEVFYEHKKDVISETEPTINQYKQNYQTTNFNEKKPEIDSRIICWNCGKENDKKRTICWKCKQNLIQDNESSQKNSQIKDFDNSYFTNLKKSSASHHSRKDRIFDNDKDDEIYEKVMLEIEEDKKVKSTWAKALAQSDGNRDKAESIYIKLRVATLKNELNDIQCKEQIKKDLEKENEIKKDANNKIYQLTNIISKYNIIDRKYINDLHYVYEVSESPVKLHIVFENGNWTVKK